MPLGHEFAGRIAVAGKRVGTRGDRPEGRGEPPLGAHLLGNGGPDGAFAAMDEAFWEGLTQRHGSKARSAPGTRTVLVAVWLARDH